MYVVACARCQDRLTDVKFVTYQDARQAAEMLGYPAADGSDELWCAECARLFDVPGEEFARHTA